MTSHVPHVFLGGVLLGYEPGGIALTRAHELIAELVDQPRHLFMDEVAWDAATPREAIAQAHKLTNALPQLRVVMEVGLVGVSVAFGRCELRLSEASFRVSALARSGDAPGLFATHAFLDACDEGDLLDLVATPIGALFVLGSGEARLWLNLERDAKLEACAHLVDLAVAALEQREPCARLEQLNARQDQVMSTLTECVDSHPAECARILVSLSRWLEPLWMRPEAQAACERLLDAPDGLEPELVDGLRLLRGMQLRKNVRLDEAIEVLSALSQDQRASPRARGLAAAEFATTSLAGGALEQGRGGYERARSLGAAHKLPAVMSYAHRGLAVVEMMAADGMSPAADERIYHHLELALELAREGGDRQQAMLSIGERAGILSTSDWRGARERMLSALTLARSLHISHYISVALGVLTDLALRRGRVEEARGYLAQSRDALAAKDLMGQWSRSLRAGLISLFARDFERADELVVELFALAPRLEHPQVPTTTMEFALLVAVATRRYERVKQLRDQPARFPIRWSSICALADAILATEGARSSALDALVLRLRDASDGGRYHDEWFELIWRLAISSFPLALTAKRRVPTIAVSASAGWFVGVDGARVDLEHRPYLHRIFRALVERHEGAECVGLDALELFELGWPGETIAFAAMKNRVYVGIAKLRGFGLQPWLVRGPDGYALSPELSIVRLIE